MYGRLTSDRRVWVVHECEVVRRGLSAMLVALGHPVVETAWDEVRPQFPPGALVVAGMSAVKPLLDGAQPEPVLVAVSDAFGDLSAREMLRLGVKGLLQVGTTSEELAACVQKVSTGGRYIPLALATAMAENAFSPALTARELEVLQCLAAGLPNKAVAAKVGIAEGTVKSHVKSILSKLGVSGRTEAVQMSVRRGLLAAPHPGRSVACTASQRALHGPAAGDDAWLAAPLPQGTAA